MGVIKCAALLFFAGLLVATPFAPFYGVLAYLGHYYLWPEHQWWGVYLSQAGVRVSLLVFLIFGGSVLLKWSSLRRNCDRLWHSQEVLLCLFIAIIGTSSLWGIAPDSVPLANSQDFFTKMWKIGLFLVLATHVVTSLKEVRRLIEFIVLMGGIYLGIVAREVPASAFVDGRLNSIGGPDFSEANFLADFLAMGILLGTVLLLQRGVARRLFFLAGGGLIANALILTRSRGAFLATAATLVVAAALADRRLRRRVLWLIPFIAVGTCLLIDQRFLDRMSTITATEDTRDISSQTRLAVWQASIRVFADYPMGVGAGNFPLVIGRYLPEDPGRDAHSTFLRCLAELGVLGVVCLITLFVNAFLTLMRCKKESAGLQAENEIRVFAYGLQLSLVALLVAGVTITLTYMEELYLFLLLPVCLERVVYRLRTDDFGELTKQPSESERPLALASTG